ncbi:fatty acid desaturase-domain-containing protein [Lasiosphaeria ovina]|uniref:Fatty acid desaturase-domain-containing protein n=1 Tax=Lasiosphaeria ovina TaxID=92902 RepID=A0AAE0K543_9PEZI|nr:fatty acid desaturase-domain-containing protein [Lasiosphaeria ovina]
MVFANLVFDARLTHPDRLVLQQLSEDITESEQWVADKSAPSGESHQPAGPKQARTTGTGAPPPLPPPPPPPASASASATLPSKAPSPSQCRPPPSTEQPGGSGVDEEGTAAELAALNNPLDERFEPTVFTSYDLDEAFEAAPALLHGPLKRYISWARGVARVETDVVFVTHLLIYFGTTLPSAAMLFARFSYPHAVLHMLMQATYIGPYTLLKHQHIHQNGVLNRRFSLLDSLFPYVMDPLMGHSWNSYFYHHVKHHHVEGNGPNDLSSTIRYQRDSLVNFLHYLGRFYFFVWLDLPRYFWRSRRPVLAAKSCFWELGTYAAIYAAWRFNHAAAVVVLIIPLSLLRIALMVGNWGQHAFVDENEPDSDFRSSITLIDVPSNRFCFNDGYHTSHHLNPLRHWREHPLAFLKARDEYARQGALVFHDIDYIGITVRLLCKDYDHLARRLVPIGSEQMALTLEGRAAMLKTHTRAFTSDEITQKYSKKSS